MAATTSSTAAENSLRILDCQSLRNASLCPTLPDTSASLQNSSGESLQRAIAAKSQRSLPSRRESDLCRFICSSDNGNVNQRFAQLLSVVYSTLAAGIYLLSSPPGVGTLAGNTAGVGLRCSSEHTKET